MELPSIAIKKILYTTDLSWSARYAFAYALNLAGKYQASLVILHVLEEVPDLDRKVTGYISEKDWAEIRARNEDEARQQLIGKRRDSGMIRDVLNKFYESARSETQTRLSDPTRSCSNGATPSRRSSRWRGIGNAI